MLHQIKAPQFYTDLGLQKHLNPSVYSKIQGLFKAFECFSSTFQGKFNFQELFKPVRYIQVLFKPVRTCCILSTEQIQNSQLYSKFQLDSHRRGDGAVLVIDKKTFESIFFIIFLNLYLRCSKELSQ